MGVVKWGGKREQLEENFAQKYYALGRHQKRDKKRGRAEKETTDASIIVRNKGRREKERPENQGRK